MNKEQKESLACKLTTPELRKRKEEVIAVLKQKVLERIELADGYSYRFDGSDEMLDTITSFIKSERMCCAFFEFKMTVSANNTILLEISGPAGVKEFITNELEM